MIQYCDIYWVFMVSDSFYLLVVELLICFESLLIFESELVNWLIEVICVGSCVVEQISCMLFVGDEDSDFVSYYFVVMFIFLECKVLCFLVKGWGINQIVVLLKKSNKMISVQKNSVMCCLLLCSNVEMYVWINSVQGM